MQGIFGANLTSHCVAQGVLFALHSCFDRLASADSVGSLRLAPILMNLFTLHVFYITFLNPWQALTAIVDITIIYRNSQSSKHSTNTMTDATLVLSMTKDLGAVRDVAVDSLLLLSDTYM